MTTTPNLPSLWRDALPPREADRHKYTRGHLGVLSGPELTTGAARLAAIAGLHAGAGAVTLYGDVAALCIHAAHVTEIMLRVAADAPALTATLRERPPAALVLGPGAGLDSQAAGLINAALAADLPTVLDADGLTLLALGALSLAGRKSPLVLTPHEGEYARLARAFGLPCAGPGDRVTRARALSRHLGAVCVLKGPRTLIATPDGAVAEDMLAGPELARAGSGDVLSGLIGSHLAQGMDAFSAAAAGVWLHAVTAARLGEALTARSLADAIRPIGG